MTGLGRNSNRESKLSVRGQARYVASYYYYAYAKASGELLRARKKALGTG